MIRQFDAKSVSLPPTIREALDQGAGLLTPAGVDSPRLQSEWLLAHVLGMKRMQLYVESGRRLSEAEWREFGHLVERRRQREPLQYILGSAEFCGLEIEVGRETLIPRPETELLAECAWTWLRSAPGTPAALDFGTGTGCLAVALAVHCPQARVYALDLSEAALGVARRNAMRHGVAKRIEFIHGAGLMALPPELRVDLVVANPPYIPTREIEELQAEVHDFEPHLALDGGADGLDFYRKLAVELGPFLAPTHRAMFEFGDGQAPAVSEILTQQNWLVETVQQDYNDKARFLIARRLEDEADSPERLPTRAEHWLTP